MTAINPLYTPPTLRHLEDRVGVGSLEEREAQLDVLYKEFAPLEAEVWAWEFARSTLRATLAMEARARLESEGKKATEALIDDLARADGRMVEALADIVGKRARATELQYEIDKLQNRTRRENGLIHHDAALAKL